MEGTSPGRKRRFRVHREFECSRIEQAMLAAAYRRILPDERLRFVQRNGDPIDGCSGDSQPASQANTDSILDYVSATGGH
jgi:hypothetical protein